MTPTEISGDEEDPGEEQWARQIVDEAKTQHDPSDDLPLDEFLATTSAQTIDLPRDLFPDGTIPPDGSVTGEQAEWLDIWQIEQQRKQGRLPQGITLEEMWQQHPEWGPLDPA